MKKFKNEKPSKAYGPNERDFLNAPTEPLKSCSENDCTDMPNVGDPIVSNNISIPEFDYTEESILKTKKDKHD